MVNMYTNEMQRHMAMQQRAYEQECRARMRYQEQQQRQLVREYERNQKAMEREHIRQEREYSKYPALSDRTVKMCLAMEIYRMYIAKGMQNVPPPATMERVLKFRRIKSDRPVPIQYRGKSCYAMKHACRDVGVTLGNIMRIPLIYHSPYGVQYDHNYNLDMYFYYCPRCKTVIYHYAGAGEGEFMESMNGQEGYC